MPGGSFSLILTHTSPGYSGLLILIVSTPAPCINSFQHTPAVRQCCCVVWLDSVELDGVLMWLIVASCALEVAGIKSSSLAIGLACRVASRHSCQPNWIGLGAEASRCGSRLARCRMGELSPTRGIPVGCIAGHSCCSGMFPRYCCCGALLLFRPVLSLLVV
jgi:hypothetical protein